MSWFGGSDPVAELDAKIEEATSEAIPNGELDMAVAMEITDVIRSKKVAPKQAMRSLKKRLTKVYGNPNTLASTLKLCDVCVKNGGAHFAVEINGKEFVDYLVDYIFRVHYDTKKYKTYASEAKYAIGSQILKLVKEWSIYFQSRYSGNHLERVYKSLSSQGYEFPEVDSQLSSAGDVFIDSQAPPDWIDGKECMICYNPFSVMNRKHHCRACGGVFCQTHSSHEIPLVSLGIMSPVRVCDDCLQIHKGSASNAAHGVRGTAPSGRPNSGSPANDAEDEDLKKAIELSLRDSAVMVTPPVRPPPKGPPTESGANDEEMDDDMKAAIAASLADYKQSELQRNTTSELQSAPNATANQPKAPESDFYSHIMSFDSNSYVADNAYNAQSGPNLSNSQYAADQFSQNQRRQSSGYGQNPQQHTNIQPAYQTQTQTQQSVQSQKVDSPYSDDLSAQEEEDINLFVQLMSGIKNDPSKQANILQDQNLAELHSKVVRLKPRLNRALRASIEKYEFFLEMNNKINTITRLYDQFLDYKLSMAYGKHSLSSPSQQQESANYNSQYFDYTQTSGAQMTGRQTGQITGGQLTGPQISGLSMTSPHMTGAPLTEPHRASNQTTGPQSSAYESYSGASAYPAHVPETPQNFYGRNEGRRESQITAQVSHGPSVYPYAAGPPHNEQQNPEQSYGEQQSEQHYDRQQYGESHDQQYNTDREPQYTEQQHGSIPYPMEPQGNGVGNARQHLEFPGPYPQEPSSPPMDDDASETESVASRYPALEEKYEEDVTEQGQGPQGPREHASMRFPSLGELNLPDLKSDSSTQLKKSTTNESKSFRAEPEPLIEL